MSEEGKIVEGEAPPGESRKGDGEGKGKPGDNRIPLDRVNEMIGAAVRKAREEFRADMAPLIEAAKAAKEQPKAEPAPKEYTKAQLAQFVEAGQLTQDAADSVWENQIIERATRKAVEGARAVVESGTLQQSITQQMSEFQLLVPEAWVEGSPEREKVAEAYASLRATGLKGTKEQLELAALRTAFGDPAALRKARGLGRSGPAESFEDSGGGAARRRQSGDEGGEDEPPKNITAKQRSHYERQMAAGRYANWAAVKDELKFASAPRRSRA